MSDASLRTAGTLLVVFPTVVLGGASLLWHRISRQTTYYELPQRWSLWRAGHAHAGVLLILSLIAVQLVDQAALSGGWKQVVCTSFPLAAILLPVAFFLSIAKPTATSPSRLVTWPTKGCEPHARDADARDRPATCLLASAGVRRS